MGVELLYSSVKTEVNQFEFQSERDEMWQGKPHPAEGALGNPDGVWGPEKLLIRCIAQQNGPLDLRLSIRRTRKTQPDGHKNEGQNIAVSVRFSSFLSHANPE